MFAKATTLLLVVALARASSPFDQPMQQLTPTQLHVIGKVGNFLQHQKLPAPWMKSSHMASARRTQDSQDVTAAIPAACKAACPGVETMAPRLENAMTAVTMKHMASIAALQSSSSGSSENMTPAQLQEMMTAMEPLYKDMFTVVFDDMCTNQADYTCVAANSAACQGTNSVSGGMASPSDPLGTSLQYGPMMNCMCNVCQGSKEALVEMTMTMMSVMMSGLTQLATMMEGGDTAAASNTALATQLEQDMLIGMCPLVGMQRCFDANPTTCSTMLTTDSLSLKSSGVAKDNTDLAAKCTAAGITAKAAPKVSTDITIKGLDFAKVDGDAAMKADVIALVKKQFLAKLPGYVADDLTVTLSSGSVIAKVELVPMPGASAETLHTVMTKESTAIATAVGKDVQAMPDDKLTMILESGTSKDQITVTASAPVSHAKTTTASAAYETGVLKIIMAMVAQVVILASM